MGLALSKSAEAAIACPQERIEKIPDFTKNENCGTFRFLELLATNPFKTELLAFQTEILNPAHRDNQSDPNFIARKLIRGIREHRLCLKKTCEKIFEQCAPTNVPKSIGLTQEDWCSEKIDRLIDIQREKIFAAAIENQTRKERSLLREKFRAIEVRLRQYFAPTIADFVRQLKRLAGKVTNFISNPN